MNYTDTADTGEDYFCSINYVEYEKEVYITDIIYTRKYGYNRRKNKC